MVQIPPQLEPLTPNVMIGILSEHDLLDPQGRGPWPELGPEDEAVPFPFGEMFSDAPVGWEDETSEGTGDWAAIAADVLGSVGQGPPNQFPPGALPDTAAWYQPIHYFGPNWGIFIRESAVIRIMFLMAGFLDGRSRRTKHLAWHLYRMALATLFLHEHYHHKAESFAIRLEMVEFRKIYVPADLAVYRPLLGTDDLLEEALANADAYLRLGRKPYRRAVPDAVFAAAREYLEWSYPLHPPGYRRAMDFLKPAAFAPAQDLLASQTLEALPVPRLGMDRWRLAPQMFRSLFNCYGVTRLVIPVGSRPLAPWFDRHPVP